MAWAMLGMGIRFYCLPLPGSCGWQMGTMMFLHNCMPPAA